MRISPHSLESTPTASAKSWSEDEALPPLAQRGARATYTYTLPPAKDRNGWNLSRVARTRPYSLDKYPREISDALQAHVLRNQQRNNLLHAAQYGLNAARDRLSAMADTLPEKTKSWMDAQDDLHNGRHLFTVAHCDAPAVEALCLSNVHAATRAYPLGCQVMSPLLVPSLLGGMTFTTFEKIAFYILENVLGVGMPMPSERRRSYLRDSALICGFGAHMPHVPNDRVDLTPFARRLLEGDHTFIRRISDTVLKPPAKAHVESNLTEAQQALVQMSKGSPYAAILAQQGAFSGELGAFVSDMKEEVCREAAIALCLQGGEITRPAAMRLEAGLEGRGEHFSDYTAITDATWSQAIRMVFNRPWRELNLECQPTGRHVSSDTVKVLARCIISRMARRLRMPAEAPKLPGQLVAAMALLTGVPVVAFLKFVELDFYRRGECIMTSASVEELIDTFASTEALMEAMDSSDVGPFMDMMDYYRVMFARFNDEPSPDRYVEPSTQYLGARQFAQWLRSTKSVLWNYPSSGGASYQFVSYREPKGEADPEDATAFEGYRYKLSLNHNFAEYVKAEGSTPFHTNAWRID